MNTLFRSIGMAALLLGTCLPAQEHEAAPDPPEVQTLPAGTGPYLGQKPPGRTPEIFAPGILAPPDRVVTRIAFSPDGNECFFSAPNKSYSRAQMYHTKRAGSSWTPPVPAPFSRPDHSYRQAFFSADGNKLYFSSNTNGSSDIWVVERTPQGWGEPQVLPDPINTPAYEGMYTEATNGTAYIESDRPGGQGDFDIWRIDPRRPGQTRHVENLGPLVNSNACETDPVVSPDGSYLIFGLRPSGGSGPSDLFVTFSDGKGGWKAPTNLNQFCPGVNTSGDEYAPTLSGDGRYLFFVRLSGTEQSGIYWVENPFHKKKATPIQ